MIEGFREQISSGQTDFAALATKESHCSSAQRGGDLGVFGPGQMQAAFEDVSALSTTAYTSSMAFVHTDSKRTFDNPAVDPTMRFH